MRKVAEKNPSAPLPQKYWSYCITTSQDWRVITEDCRESSQVSLQRAGNEACDLAHVTHFTLKLLLSNGPFLQVGLVFRFLRLLSKLLKLVLVFPNKIQLENIKLLECGSKENKQYTETGNLGDSLLVQIYIKRLPNAASRGVTSSTVLPVMLIPSLLLHRLSWQQLYRSSFSPKAFARESKLQLANFQHWK